MPTNLTGNTIASTYGQLLHVDGGATSTRKTVNDGDGTATALKVGTTSAAVAGDLIVEGANALKLADTDSTHSVALKAPATVTTDVTLTLPATAGSDGNVLSTDGSGNLSWVSAGGIGTVLDTQTFNASGTWTKPSQGSIAVIQVWGGGGSGGKGVASGPAGGGGGGAYCERVMRLSNLPSTVSVTVGAGGASQTTGSTAGNNGGTTTFGSYLSAFGGGGGAYNASGGSGGGGGGAGATGQNGGTNSSIQPAGGADDSARYLVGAHMLGTAAFYNTALQDPVHIGYVLEPNMYGPRLIFGTYAGGRGARGAIGGAAGDQSFGSSDGIAWGGFGGGGGGGGFDGTPTTTDMNSGGLSIYGGAGGGGGANATRAGAGGTSTYGGNGGSGSFDANNGVAGSAPGGGGGGTEGGNSGAGGSGRCIVTVY